MKAELFERLLAERAAKRAAAVVTRLADGAQALVDEGGVTGDLPLTPEQLDETRRRLLTDRSGVLDSSAGALFARCHTQPPRLVVVGAVHITQALAPMAAMAGYEVLVIDPRRAFATGAVPVVDVHREDRKIHAQERAEERQEFLDRWILLAGKTRDSNLVGRETSPPSGQYSAGAALQRFDAPDRRDAR